MGFVYQKAQSHTPQRGLAELSPSSCSSPHRCCHR
ncbi:hypothetical protein JMJ77_0009576, partial [Colletotrichum scovillei]